MTAARAARLGDPADGGPERAPTGGVRVVLDARPLQEPDRAPLTAAYLDGAARRPMTPTRSTASRSRCCSRSDADDPTARFERLDVVGRRLLPPTRLLRSGALTVDPFLLSGASLGAAWRADRSGAAGAVYHAAGGSIPLATGLPLVVTLLDLAPWELPGAYQRGRRRPVRAAAPGPAAPGRGGGHRRHPGDRAGGAAAAPRPARPDPRRFRSRRGPRSISPTGRRRRSPGGRRGAIRHERRPDPRAERDRLGLPRALRHLLRPVRRPPGPRHAAPARSAELSDAGRPAGLAADEPWPPRVLFAGATPDDRAALARAAAREEVGEALVYAPRLDDERLAALVRGARAALLPVLSDSAGLPAIEAIACGVPVVASTVGALPEIVGAAGILVEPRDSRAARVGARDGVPRRPGPRDAGRGRPRAGRRRAADLGRRRRARRGPSTPRAAAPTPAG